MIAALAGFAIRYLPNLFGWVGDFFKGREDDRRQEKMAELQLKIEEKRAELALKGAIVQAEITEALASLQAELASIRASVEDRKSAREYGVKLVGLMAGTLRHGKELGVPTWVLSCGWIAVIGVEVLSASIQPMIAVWAFGMWIHYRVTSGVAWGVEDWMLVEAVVGFFLAGRVMKWTEAKRVRTAVGD